MNSFQGNLYVTDDGFFKCETADVVEETFKTYLVNPKYGKFVAEDTKNKLKIKKRPVDESIDFSFLETDD